MKANKRFEINDLIDNAVTNAVARRNEALSTVSNEDSRKVTGGSLFPIILGGIFNNILNQS